MYRLKVCFNLLLFGLFLLMLLKVDLEYRCCHIYISKSAHTVALPSFVDAWCHNSVARIVIGLFCLPDNGFQSSPGSQDPWQLPLIGTFRIALIGLQNVLKCFGSCKQVCACYAIATMVGLIP